jgi:hypothetical protein
LDGKHLKCQLAQGGRKLAAKREFRDKMNQQPGQPRYSDRRGINSE